MKLRAKSTITNGTIKYNAGDIFETDKDFTESLVPHAAEYLEPIVAEDDVVEIPENLEELKVNELKQICKDANLEGYSNKSKPELIELIESSLDEE